MAEIKKNVSPGMQGQQGQRSGEPQQPSQQGRQQQAQAQERGMQRAQPRSQGLVQGGRSGSPFGFMSRMMEDMDRLFDDFGFGRLMPSLSFGEDLAGGGSFGSGVPFYNPEIEVFQRGDDLVVRADLPGMSDKDLNVSLADDALTIEGERREESEKTEGGVYHSERSYGSFRRMIPLPRGIDTSTCDAKLDNGVLEITLKLPQEKKQKVQIKSGAQQAQGGVAQGQQQQVKPASSQPQTGSVANGPASSQARH
jgi:HSP20 family protein